MNMGRKKQKKPYIIPNNILNLLNEHTNRGWMLFTYDDLNTLRLYCNFDDPVVSKSLRADMETYLNSVRQIETDITIQNIVNQNNDDSSQSSI